MAQSTGQPNATDATVTKILEIFYEEPMATVLNRIYFFNKFNINRTNEKQIENVAPKLTESPLPMVRSISCSIRSKLTDKM